MHYIQICQIINWLIISYAIFIRLCRCVKQSNYIRHKIFCCRPNCWKDALFLVQIMVVCLLFKLVIIMCYFNWSIKVIFSKICNSGSPHKRFKYEGLYSVPAWWRKLTFSTSLDSYLLTFSLRCPNAFITIPGSEENIGSGEEHLRRIWVWY